MRRVAASLRGVDEGSPARTPAGARAARHLDLEVPLYREAEVRRRLQLRREEEAWAEARQQCKPQLSEHSRALCQGRLERELREAFESCRAPAAAARPHGVGVSPAWEALSVPRCCLPQVLEEIGLLSGRRGEEEEAFCGKLGLLLDREDSGRVGFEGLRDFMVRALHRDGGQDEALPGLTLEEECFCHLERRLTRSVGRLLSNRHRKHRADPARSSPPPASQPGEPAVPSRTPRGARRPSAPCRGHDEDGSPPSGEARPLSRCHLLYHQAVFAAQENAQLGEEIRLLREREEMRECTFRPRLASWRPPSQGGAPPRNFEATVARMRNASQRRAQLNHEKRRVPCGENYERLRRLRAQPPSCSSRDRVSPRRTPLMYVDVNIGRGRTGRIGVHEGDDLGLLSRNFARAFQLGAEAARRLEELLHQAVQEQAAAEAFEEPDSFARPEERGEGGAAD